MRAASSELGKEKVYVKMRINGTTTSCLVDTGSDATLIPVIFTKGCRILPTGQRIFAANGTDIPLIGHTAVVAKLGKQRLVIVGLVTEHVSQPYLGIDWLTDHDANWNFRKKELTVNGVRYPLTSRKAASAWTRRVVLSDDVTIPPMTQMNVETKVIFNGPACERRTGKQRTDDDNVWATEAHEAVRGVLVARTLLPNRACKVPVQLFNVTDRPVTVRGATVLGNLERLHTLSAQSTAPPTQEAPADAEKRIVDEMMAKVDQSVPDEFKVKLRQLLMRYSSVFSKDELDLGFTDLVTHRIDTGDARPVRQQLRRYPPAHLDVIDQHLQDMQRQGIIEPCSSPWASNIVLAKKHDGTMRCCIDYRQLNSCTIGDAYPVPRQDMCLDALAGSRWFTCCDLRSSFHQVKLDPGSADKTAFITRRGMFRYRTMPFGLTNAVATFQRLMDLVLSGVSLDICIAYLDDTIIHSATLEQHLQNVELILQKLQGANLKLKPSKCFFLQTSVKFLGHIVSVEGLQTDPEKTRLIDDWPVPTSLKQLRAFLGLAGYYRRFVKGFSKKAAPLNGLLKKGHPYQWTPACQSAFQELKDALRSPPILALPDDTGVFYLDTDASDKSIGAVLSQMQDGQEKVIAYAGRALNKNELNYCAFRKELLAVVYFTKHFKQYLLSRFFYLRSDNSALQWLRRTPEPLGQNARWLQQLEEFSFHLSHRKGTSHANADALSRHPCLSKPSCTACHPELEQQKLSARGVRFMTSLEPIRQLERVATD